MTISGHRPSNSDGDCRPRAASRNIQESRARNKPFCPLSRRSFGRIANLPSSTSTGGENDSAAEGSIRKKTAPNTQKICENNYFTLAETAAISERSEFFTGETPSFLRERGIHTWLTKPEKSAHSRPFATSSKFATSPWTHQPPPSAR